MTEEEENLKQKHMQIHGLAGMLTDFENPHSIMDTAAILLRASMQLYSVVLPKDQMFELLDIARTSLDQNTTNTTFH